MRASRRPRHRRRRRCVARRRARPPPRRRRRRPALVAQVTRARGCRAVAATSPPRRPPATAGRSPTRPTARSSRVGAPTADRARSPAPRRGPRRATTALAVSALRRRGHGQSVDVQASAAAGPQTRPPTSRAPRSRARRPRDSRDAELPTSSCRSPTGARSSARLASSPPSAPRSARARWRRCGSSSSPITADSRGQASSGSASSAPPQAVVAEAPRDNAVEPPTTAPHAHAGAAPLTRPTRRASPGLDPRRAAGARAAGTGGDCQLTPAGTSSRSTARVVRRHIRRPPRRRPGGWHHGEDIFAPLGTPLLAVADGTVFSVGWNDIGGWRLWLRDGRATSSTTPISRAYSPLAIDGSVSG